jgi:hypothetical protein
VHDSERERIFGDWLAGHKGILSKWSTRMRSSTQTAGISFRRSPFRSGARCMRSVAMTLMCVGSVAAGIWTTRRQVQKDVLPRKRRLEALLKELDAP